MKKWMLKAAGLSLGSFLLVACNSNEYSKTESGLEYKYITKGDGVAQDSGTVVILNMSYSLGDSVLFSSAERGGPVPVMHQDSITNPGGIEEGFNMLTKGDSIVFLVSAENLFTKTFRQPTLPEGFSPTDTIVFNLGVVDILDQEGMAAWSEDQRNKQTAKMEQEQAIQKQVDTELIENYLSEKGIEAQQTESGLFYVITKEGKGPKAKAGDKVQVNYAGTLLNGTLFDSNIAEVAKANGNFEENNPYEPIEFVLGTRAVISGWDEGLALLNEGSKATFYIPSSLAYGPRQRSEVILPNSVLIFDVELVKVSENKKPQ